MQNVKLTAGYAAFQAALDCGVDVCFANPGTTEMPLVAVLDEMPKMRSVLGLFEGVCTGAADGYARVTGRPALTLLHLGPGFANGIANLHNARRAHTPIVNIIGDHASWHLKYDAPLTSDIVSLASPVSVKVDTINSAAHAPVAMRDAIDASVAAPGGVVSLIHPVDFQYEEMPSADKGAAKKAKRIYAAPDTAAVAEVAERMKQAKAPLVLVGGSGLSEAGHIAAGRLAQVSNAIMYGETFPAIAARGGGLPNLDRLPYFPEKAIEVMEKADLVVLVCVPEPVAYFGYEGIASELAPKDRTVRLAELHHDGAAALHALADALGAGDFTPQAPSLPEAASGALDATKIATTIARNIPENAIVSVEGASCGYAFFAATAQSKKHQAMTNTGGAIGQGLPVALGASIGAPDKPVICLQSDGSGQYTVQSLWTMAREKLPIVVCLAANQKYAVLQTELNRIGLTEFGDTATALTDLVEPAIDWVALAQGYGVEACKVETAEELDAAIQHGLKSGQPYLIEMRY